MEKNEIQRCNINWYCSNFCTNPWKLTKRCYNFNVKISWIRSYNFCKIFSFFIYTSNSWPSFLKSLELVNSINYHDIELLFFIILTSFIFAYISIYWLMKFLVNFSYTVFVIYRLILGGIILFFISFNLI